MILAMVGFAAAILALGPLRPHLPWPAALRSSVGVDGMRAQPSTAATAKPAPGGALTVPPPAAAGAPDPSQPVFDVVRVEPNGEAVIAGRAAPRSTVELLRNGVVVERAVADAEGAFAITTPALPVGEYELTLRARTSSGARRASSQIVGVTVKPSGPPLVALVTPGKPTALLSNPLAEPSSNGTAAPITIELAEAEANGSLFVVGRAPPGASVRLYLNDAYLASAVARSDGQVSFAVKGGVKPGSYSVRLDDVTRGIGEVRSRAEVPFTMPAAVAARPLGRDGHGIESENGESATTAFGAPAVAPARADREADASTVVDGVNTRMVARGDSLWRISREVYRIGQRYTTIYKANRDQIANPHRIYPGQVFVLPSEGRL
ncbi:hypothetical protein GCM10010994_34220 [Chelatococcus reniformis]|uniref:LysM domain-containing protein n=1 Tax=Chelatococcus reniformis TaxID=1494448 RepID=A0A916UIC9_9HYPH|nr:hypothetical protein GCM10010994_34220 [Chelatococcus reniformis]